MNHERGISLKKGKRAKPMDRLLNIEDAAEFLNVSEMTVRRWTNSGALKCYRVGGKRERRFYMSDVEGFLHGLGSHGLMPLGYGALKVPDGSHLTHFYSGNDEAIEVSVSCALEGLKRNEVVLVVVPPERRRGFMNNVERRGGSIERILQKGRLSFSTGKDSPKEMIRYLAGFTERSDKFRLVGDMTWALRKGWDLAALRALEEAADFLPRSEGVLLLCQYSLEDFSGADIMMASELHKQIVYRGRLEKSPYYSGQETD